MDFGAEFELFYFCLFYLTSASFGQWLPSENGQLNPVGESFIVIGGDLNFNKTTIFFMYWLCIRFRSTKIAVSLNYFIVFFM